GDPIHEGQDRSRARSLRRSPRRRGARRHRLREQRRSRARVVLHRRPPARLAPSLIGGAGWRRSLSWKTSRTISSWPSGSSGTPATKRRSPRTVSPRWSSLVSTGPSSSCWTCSCPSSMGGRSSSSSARRAGRRMFRSSRSPPPRHAGTSTRPSRLDARIFSRSPITRPPFGTFSLNTSRRRLVASAFRILRDKKKGEASRPGGDLPLNPSGPSPLLSKSAAGSVEACKRLVNRPAGGVAPTAFGLGAGPRSARPRFVLRLFDRFQQSPRRPADLGHGRVERPGIALRGRAVAAHLADVLKRGGATETEYRVFYLFGAILNVAWLALGTLFLLVPRVGRWGLWVVVALTVVAAVAVFASPVNLSAAADTGKGFDAAPLPRYLAAIGSGVGSVILIGG